MLTVCMKSIDGYWSSWGNWMNSKLTLVKTRNRICKNSLFPISFRLHYQSSEQVKKSEYTTIILVILSITICICLTSSGFLLKWFYSYLKNQQFMYEYIQDRVNRKISSLKWRRSNSDILKYWNSLPTDDENAYSSIEEIVS